MGSPAIGRQGTVAWTSKASIDDHVVDFSLDFDHTTVESTTLDPTGGARVHTPTGIYGVSGSFNSKYDDAVPITISQVTGAASDLSISPDGTTTFAGNALCGGFSVSGTFDGEVTQTINYLYTGVVTHS